MPMPQRAPLVAAILLLAGILTATSASAADKQPEPTPSHQAGETARGAWETGKEAVRNAWQSTKETARQVWGTGKETAKEGFAAGKETAKDAWGATKEKTGEVTRDVKEGWKDGQK
jgi:hypothetical protein